MCMLCRSSFVLLYFCTFGHCVVCSSSIYGFWLPPFGIFKLFLGPSWSWSHGSWIYNYVCNQCLSPLLKLRVRIPLLPSRTQYNFMWENMLVTCGSSVVFPGYYTIKTDRVRVDCSFCWYWWNCWSSLLKLSFDKDYQFSKS
jgi:hypothetical protein